jgi:hypothetical protein
MLPGESAERTSWGRLVICKNNSWEREFGRRASAVRQKPGSRNRWQVVTSRPKSRGFHLKLYDFRLEFLPEYFESAHSHW